MSDPLRFGICGAGIIGAVHARAIATLEDAELAAVADPKLDRAESLAVEHGARAYRDLGDMLMREGLDVVSICTPSGLHAAQAIEVMRSGRHVIVEKPMAITLPAIDAMLATQRETQTKLAVISQHRFDPASQEVRRLIRDGRLGTLMLGNAQILWWRSQAYYDSDGWRGSWALDGGGVLMNQAIHSIDLLQWFLGRVRSVQACTDTRIHRMETEDVAAAALRFTSGALGTIAATTGAYPGVVARIEVLGDRGSAIIENDLLVYQRFANTGEDEPGAYGAAAAGRAIAAPDDSVSQNPAALAIDTHRAQIADMIAAIRENRSPLVEGRAGKHPVEIILAIYESARTGREVEIR